jgi:hypothetical protein
MALMASLQRLDFPAINKLPGWFSKHDYLAFNYILKTQFDQGNSGDTLEIGAYAGKSAVLIGLNTKENESFHVCDVFATPEDLENAEEIGRSYANLSREIFEANYLSFFEKLPVIHECLSSELKIRLKKSRFRFIHIDGSHLYKNVKEDLDFAVAHIHKDGVIAIDDFRSEHTFGVARATWDLVNLGRLIPILMTPAKIYLAPKESKFENDHMASYFASNGVNITLEQFNDEEFIRTCLARGESVYARKIGKSDFVPPILLEILRRRFDL